MARKRKLEVTITGDASGAKRAFSEVEKSGGKLNRAFGGVKQAAKVGMAGVATAAGAGALALGAVGDKFDQVRDTIRVGTGATGKQLEQLQGDFKAVVRSVPADFGDAGSAIADLNTRLGLTGEPLQTVSKQMLEMSRITGEDLSGGIESASRVMGDWGVAAGDIPGTLDKLFRASQSTGISVGKLGEQMVKYGAPARQLGFSFDQTAALLGKFEKEGVNAELVMGSMRQALGKMAREGEPAVETFTRVTEQIKNAGSASEANKLALELFGARAGPDMAAAIREGRFAVDDLVGVIEGGKETILGAAEDTNSWRESWKLLVNNAMVLVEPIATKVFDALSDLMQWVVDTGIPAVEDLWEVWGPRAEEAGEIISGVIDTVGGAFQALREGELGTFAEHIDGLFGGDGSLVAPIRTAAEVITEITDQIAALFSGDGKMTRETEELRDFWDDTWAQVEEIIDAARDAIEGIVETLVTVVTTLWDRFGEDLIAYARDTWEFIEGIIDDALEIIQGIFEVFAGLFTGDWDRFWGGIERIVDASWEAIQRAVQFAIDTVRTIVSVGMGLLQEAWDLAWNAVKTAVRTAWEHITEGVRKGRGWVLELVRELPGKIMGALAALPGKLLALGKKMIGGLADGIRRGAGSIGSAVGGAISSAVSALNPFGDGLGEAIAGGPALRPAAGYKRQWDAVRQMGLPVRMTSGFRPGSITSSGNLSYHARGRAVDLAGTPAQMMATFQALKRVYGRISKELIYSPAGSGQIRNGRAHFYSGAVRRNHFDHVHWALEHGGYFSRRSGQPWAGQIVAAERHPEIMAPEPVLRSIVREETAGLAGGGVEVHVHVQDRRLADLIDVRIVERDREQVRMAVAGVR